MFPKRIFTALALLIGLTSAAYADTSSMNPDVTGMGILENDYVKAGVNGTTGTLGSGGNTSPGLLYDSTGTGTFNTSYDYLTPGSPFDGFSVMVDGTNYTNNNTGSTGITGDGNGLTDGDGTLSWTGGVTSVFNITNTYTLGTTAEHIEIESSITMGVDADDVYFGRFIDPDARAATGDSSSTDNVLGYGVIPDSNVAFSEALSSRYALGLYSTDSNVDAGITGWTTDANSYTENAVDGDGSLTNTGDNTIGLSWHWTSVSIGDILTASYAYIFGPSAFDAADAAMTAGAGGGADVSSWGTLEDVGSATDAASGGSEPVITYSDPVVDTDRPVLTASITHHTASETSTIQTIDREKTTTVTTPMEIIEYTDGVETDRAVTDSVIVTTVTDPGSFTGRIDQITTAQDAINTITRSLEFDGPALVRSEHKYDNGMKGDTKGFSFGGTRQNDEGIVVGGGFATTTTDLKNDGDSVEAKTITYMGSVGKEFDFAYAEAKAQRSTMTYDVSRTIGDFSNSGTTKGSDTRFSIMLDKNINEKLSVIGGVTRGRQSVAGYTETGSVQSARTVAKSTTNYTYGTVGGNLDLGLLGLSAVHHTDGVNELSASISKETDRVTWEIGVKRSMTDLGNSNSLDAGLNIKF